ncbi:hypothetical protein [Phage blackswan219-1]|nr:hypothetical protein [Phage blackswan219-1]
MLLLLLSPRLLARTEDERSEARRTNVRRVRATLHQPESRSTAREPGGLLILLFGFTGAAGSTISNGGLLSNG